MANAVDTIPPAGADGTAHSGTAADESKKAEKAEGTKAAQDEQGNLAYPVLSQRTNYMTQYSSFFRPYWQPQGSKK